MRKVTAESACDLHHSRHAFPGKGCYEKNAIFSAWLMRRIGASGSLAAVPGLRTMPLAMMVEPSDTSILVGAGAGAVPAASGAAMPSGGIGGCAIGSGATVTGSCATASVFGAFRSSRARPAPEARCVGSATIIEALSSMSNSLGRAHLHRDHVEHGLVLARRRRRWSACCQVGGFGFGQRGLGGSSACADCGARSQLGRLWGRRVPLPKLASDVDAVVAMAPRTLRAAGATGLGREGGRLAPAADARHLVGIAEFRQTVRQARRRPRQRRSRLIGGDLRRRRSR